MLCRSRQILDLYKHAFRLSPLICSDLAAEAFELARDIRILDLRASPYDFAEIGFVPVKIETPEGKAEYVAKQREFSERGAPIRAQLIEGVEQLLATGVDRRFPTTGPFDELVEGPRVGSEVRINRSDRRPRRRSRTRGSSPAGSRTRRPAGSTRSPSASPDPRSSGPAPRPSR
jgi:hypothetical protein